MTANRRIALNIIATYGRSLYALALGLFTARWALEALGHVDYGLFGLVGGLTVFVTIFDNLLATGVGRFYAVSVGKMQTNRKEGLLECRRWFSTAVVIHTILPIALVSIGYPFGIWAVEHYLTIPPDRIAECEWVWRFSCLTCFVAMIGVPFKAMYTAKQEIAELTIYSFVTTTLNAVFLYYIVKHPGVWLAKYAAWMCMLVIVPQLIIICRAGLLYEECRFSLASLTGSLRRVRELLGYSGWLTFGFFGGLCRGQGIAILINRAFGPAMNASMTLGNTLSTQCDTLSGSLTTAFSPAIMNAYGAGNLDQMRSLAYRACKMATIFLLIFAIPLALEVDEVLLLWLKNPPAYAGGLCVFFLISAVIDKTAVGHMIAVNARGKIALYQAVLGTSLIAALPFAVAFVSLGIGVYSIGIALIFSMMLCAWGRVYFARTLVGMSSIYWLKHILLPLVATALLSTAVGLLPRFILAPSFVRICLTTILVELSLIPICWFFVMDDAERIFIRGKIPFLKGGVK